MKYLMTFTDVICNIFYVRTFNKFSIVIN
jgi:hypothetical protein